MTSWDGFLADLAEHLAFSIEKMLTDKYTNTPKIAHHLILQELREKLLPLLEAADQVCGEAMSCICESWVQDVPVPGKVIILKCLACETSYTFFPDGTIAYEQEAALKGLGPTRAAKDGDATC